MAPGKTPILLVHGIGAKPGMWTGGTDKWVKNGNVEGTDVPPLKYLEDKVGADRAAGYTFDWSSQAGPQSEVSWVDGKEGSPGNHLSEAIRCVAEKSQRKVIVVAHSMGGLLTKFAVNQPGIREKVAAVFTMGTPYKGSFMAGAPGESSERGIVGSILKHWCKFSPNDESFLCFLAGGRQDPGIKGMRIKEGAWGSLPAWPPGLPLYRLASSIPATLTPVHVLPFEVKIPGGSFGDAVVDSGSQTEGSTQQVQHECPVAYDSFPELFGTPCFHLNQPKDPKLLDHIIQQIKAKNLAQGKIDWSNHTYDLTCDNITDKPVAVDIRNGKGVAQGNNLGNGYRTWDVKVQQTVHGTLPKLGDVTAVLFSCSPQPSNFTEQELRVYRTADGSPVGRTPTFEVSGLSPQYQAETLVIKDGKLAADVKFYGPHDSHASGPSELHRVTWTWNGERFDAHDAPGPATGAPGRVDLSHEPITVNGMGVLKLDMTRTEAEKAIGAPIPEGPGGPKCSDLSVQGGPEGLLLRFAQDKLVAVYVLPSASASLATESGVHRGITREDVLRTYAGEVGSRHLDDTREEITFAPTAPEFKGKVIKFHTVDGKVDTFIAGKQEFAELLPCGGD
ncbi:alpha/beta fold hydrolase [Streptomyces sp. NPDC021096]|uniref:esterase/lipase family protein n=1 Tax=Streptomyces sp. NPDC021096 TaxID=3154792 RepID=UPI0033E252C4